MKRDISRVDGVNRDEGRARRLMCSYARLQATQSAISVIKADLEANESLPISVLKKLAARIDTVKMSSPSFLMMLTATGDFAYRREDGVVVCPIGCLKP